MASAKMEYGSWRVDRERERGGVGGGVTSVYYVRPVGGDESERVEVGDGESGKARARTLAAALDKAGVFDADVFPPEWGARSITTRDEWEEWAADQRAVPAKVATAGNAAVAGWLKVVGKELEGWIATKLDVSEQTVRQYLSDLREGRR